VSFFGGATDYPDWYLKHGGAVLGTAIDKYCYISLRHLPPFFEHKHRFAYSQIETVDNLDEVDHPAIRHVLKEFKIKDGLEIHHDGDLPARSGLGSSSSFTVGLINALRAHKGLISSKQFLATEAIRIEQGVIKENVGSQDQIWAAYGGTNRIDFRVDGTFAVSPIIMPRHRHLEIESHLILFFTGLSRIASTVAEENIANLDQREKQLHTMRAMVDQAVDILQSSGEVMKEFGQLLHESWSLKRELASKISNQDIDEIYQGGLDAGAIGGKILGAGGGGFVLFVVRPQDRKALRKRLNNLICVDFKIGVDGSKVVLYEPNGLMVDG